MVGATLTHGVVVAMTMGITNHQSEGPLGDVGDEKAKACVSAARAITTPRKGR